jgi:hypothetical protein
MCFRCLPRRYLSVILWRSQKMFEFLTSPAPGMPGGVATDLDPHSHRFGEGRRAWMLPFHALDEASDGSDAQPSGPRRDGAKVKEPRLLSTGP